MRIVIDLDGTICSLRKHNQDYDEVFPLPGVQEKLSALKTAGHHIIVNSARHMKTCNGDIEAVKQKVEWKTINWLQKHNIPYDELIFGKPYAELYIDDLAQTFKGWDEFNESEINAETVNIVIPMAGLGTRFSNAGFTEPKPLIKARKRTMIEWAMESFNFLPRDKKVNYIFIILKEHNAKYKLVDKLHEIFGLDIHFIIIDSPTRGQAETCLLAKKYINNNNRLFIFNCDTFSITPNLWTEITKYEPEGLLVCFESNDPRYSYAKLDEYGYVSMTAEKNPISSNASNGMYYYKHGSSFVYTAEKMISAQLVAAGEYYVAPTYNQLIAKGRRIRILQAQENWILGTPEELKYFEETYEQ